MAEGGPRGQSAESASQHHHHQWRFKRFDAPRYGAESLEFTKFLADRWSRPKHPNKLALGEHGLLRTLIIIQFLRPGRRSSGISHPLMGVPQGITQVADKRHRGTGGRAINAAGIITSRPSMAILGVMPVVLCTVMR